MISKSGLIKVLGILYWRIYSALDFLCDSICSLVTFRMEEPSQQQQHQQTENRQSMTRNSNELYTFRPYKLEKVISADAFKKFAPYPKARSGHRVVCTDGSLYSFGGFNPEFTARIRRRRAANLFSQLWRFNLVSKEWHLFFGGRTLTMPDELASNAMVAEKGLIFVYGGTGYPFGEICSNKCYLLHLNPAERDISLLEATGELPTPTYGPAILIHGKYLYTLGGTTGFDYSLDVHRLDLRTRVWECVYLCKPYIQDDPPGRYRHEIVYDGRQVYVIGGGTDVSVFDLAILPAFDLETNKWSYLKTKPDQRFSNSGFPSFRRCHSCVQYNTDVGLEAVIAGGCAEDKYFDDIWKINFRTKQWKLLSTAKLNFPTYFHDAATSGNGCMYVFGGIEVKPAYDPEENADYPSLTRTNDLHKIWVTIPKLSEICWDALTFYDAELCKHPEEFLLRVGIPKSFVQRVHPYTV